LGKASNNTGKQIRYYHRMDVTVLVYMLHFFFCFVTCVNCSLV